MPTGHDHAHGLVQDDLLTGIKALGCLLVDCDPHLAATRVDVGRPIVVQLHHGPVRRGGLGELLHLVAQDGDPLPGRLQGGVQLLVAGVGPCQLAVGIPNLGFEATDLAGGVDQAASQFCHLLVSVVRSGFAVRGVVPGPVRLLTFPEFGHAYPPVPTLVLDHSRSCAR